jgi:hypothetical protein
MRKPRQARAFCLFRRRRTATGDRDVNANVNSICSRAYHALKCGARPTRVLDCVELMRVHAERDVRLATSSRGIQLAADLQFDERFCWWAAPKGSAATRVATASSACRWKAGTGHNVLWRSA